MFSYGISETPALLSKLIADWKKTNSSGRFMGKDVLKLPDSGDPALSHQMPDKSIDTPVWQRLTAVVSQTMKYCGNNVISNASHACHLIIGNSVSLRYQAVLLPRAASKGYFAIVRLLLASGVDPNTPDGNGNTSLFLAVSKGYVDIVRLLLVNGADPNTLLGSGNTPLSNSLYKEHWKIVQLLGKCSAIPRKATVLKTSPTTMSKVHSLLLANGADPGNASDALTYATMKGDWRLFSRRLKNRAALRKHDNWVNPVLSVAAMYGYSEIVNLLLHHSANPGKAIPALIYATVKGYSETVRVLLANGVSPGKAPAALIYAAANRNVEIVRLLLASGADPGKVPAALIYAVANGSVEIVRLLLANGADPNTRLGSGNTVLLSLYIEHWTIVERLAACGLILREDAVSCWESCEMYLMVFLRLQAKGLSDEKYYGALEYATMKEDWGFFGPRHSNRAGLSTHDDWVKPVLSMAALFGDVEIVNLLLTHGAKPGKAPAALIYASVNSDFEIVKLLVTHGTDPGKVPAALIYASSKGDFEIVRFLVANGADPGKAPAALIKATQNRHLKIVRFLVANGADPNTVLYLGVVSENAKGVAIARHYLEIVRFYQDQAWLLQNHVSSFHELQSLQALALRIVRAWLIRTCLSPGRLTYRLQLESAIKSLPMPQALKDLIGSSMDLNSADKPPAEL